MSLDTSAPWWPLSLPRFRGGATQILALVLVALIIVFWLLLGDQLFSVRALQSMAFQLPELGILSLAIMVTLLSGGLNLSIIATANLCALAMAWVLTTHATGGGRRNVGSGS
jgi:simple sugar transport system permease protein